MNTFAKLGSWLALGIVAVGCAEAYAASGDSSEAGLSNLVAGMLGAVGGMVLNIIAQRFLAKQAGQDKLEKELATLTAIVSFQKDATEKELARLGCSVDKLICKVDHLAEEVTTLKVHSIPPQPSK